MPSSPSLHDPEAKKAIEARLARVEGQVRGIRRMVGDDHDCEEIALQLAAYYGFAKAEALCAAAEKAWASRAR